MHNNTCQREIINYLDQSDVNGIKYKTVSHFSSVNTSVSKIK